MRIWVNSLRRMSSFQKLKDRTYRVRDGQRKLNCPHPDYPHAFIVLPPEWLGKHAILKDKAISRTEGLGADITDLSVCLSILDDWGNIPGLENKKNPNDWDFEIVPIPVLAWISEIVLNDLALAYTVPKESSEQLQSLSLNHQRELL